MIGESSPCGDREHRLVQQRETLLAPPLLDQDETLGMDGEREQIRVAEPLARLRRHRCGGERGFVVARRLVLHCDGQEEIAPLDAVPPLALDEALGTAEPPRRAAHLSAQCDVDAQKEGAARRAKRYAALEMCVMSPFEDAQEVVDAAEHLRSRCQQLEVVGCERRRLIGLRQRQVRVFRRPSRVGRTASVEGAAGRRPVVDPVRRCTAARLVERPDPRFVHRGVTLLQRTHRADAAFATR
jgi:hypothetical protein